MKSLDLSFHGEEEWVFNKNLDLVLFFINIKEKSFFLVKILVFVEKYWFGFYEEYKSDFYEKYRSGFYEVEKNKNLW